MHGYSKHLKLVSSLLLQAFVLQQIAYAAPEIKPIEIRFQEEKLKVNFSLPASVATIEDSWKSPEKNSKTLILLQDAHTNDSGQINLAKTLDIILKSQSADSPQYVFTEGALGNNSLSDLRQKASLAKREEVAMAYIKKGLLHGAEYLDLTSEHNFVLWGVENRDQYVASLEAYKKVAASREKFQAYLSTIDQTIETLKLQILNPALYKFNKDYESFKDEKIVLTDYLDTLTAQAKALNLSLDSMPHLKSLKTLKDKESQINFKKATDEEIEAVASLAKEEQEELKNLAETLERSPFKIGSQEKNEDKAFYVVLEDVITRNAKQSSKSYPELQKYFEYLKVAKTIDLKAALKEIDSLEEKIFTGLSLSQNEKNLILCEKTVYYLHKLFDLKLTPEDYRRYQTITREFPITELTGFLNKQIMERKKYYERAIFLEEGYEEIVAQSEKFYELTSERDEHFIKEALNKMDAENQNQAVLITGGFHEANLKSLLKSKNISYVSIVPQIFHETNQKRYENILLNQTKLTLNPKSAQITQSTIITPSAGSDGVAFPAIWVNGLVLRHGIYADINPSFQPSFPAPYTPDRRSTTLPTTPRIPAPTQVPVKQAVGSRLAFERGEIEFSSSWGIAINLEKQVGLYPQGDSYGPANVDTSKTSVLATIEVLRRAPSSKIYKLYDRIYVNRPMDETMDEFKAWMQKSILNEFAYSGFDFSKSVSLFVQNLRSQIEKSGSRLSIQPEEIRSSEKVLGDIRGLLNELTPDERQAYADAAYESRRFLNESVASGKSRKASDPVVLSLDRFQLALTKIPRTSNVNLSGRTTAILEQYFTAFGLPDNFLTFNPDDLYQAASDYEAATLNGKIEDKHHVFAVSAIRRFVYDLQEISVSLRSGARFAKSQAVTDAIKEISDWKKANKGSWNRPSEFNPLITNLQVKATQVYYERKIYSFDSSERMRFAVGVYDARNFRDIHAILKSLYKEFVTNVSGAGTLDPASYRKLSGKFSLYERKYSINDYHNIRYGANFIFDFFENEVNLLENQSLVNDINTELTNPGGSNLPMVAAIQDLHNGARRLMSLVGFAYGLPANIYKDIHSLEDLERLLISHNIDINRRPLRIVGLADQYDRGPDALGTADTVRWIAKNGHAKFFEGNHDFWRAMAVLRIQRIFDKKGVDYNSKEEKTHHVAYWAADMPEHAGWLDIELDQINEKRFNAIVDGINRQIELINASASTTKKVKPLSAISLGKVRERFDEELKLMKERNKKLRNAKQTNPNDTELQAKPFEELPDIFIETSKALQAYIEDRNKEIQAINSRNQLTLPVIQFNVLTRENFHRDPEVIERTLWELKNFRLFYVDLLGNLHMHNILPLKLEGGFDVSYGGKEGLEALELMSQEVRAFFQDWDTIPDDDTFREKMWERLGPIFEIINSWYSDKPGFVFAKAENVKAFIENGGLEKLGLGILGHTTQIFAPRKTTGFVIMGHNERGKFEGEKARLPYVVLYPEIGSGVFNIDYELSPGYSNRGAILTFFKRDTRGRMTGIRLWGYKPGSDKIEDLTFHDVEGMNAEQRQMLEKLSDGQSFMKWFREKTLSVMADHLEELIAQAKSTGRMDKAQQFSMKLADVRRQILQSQGSRLSSADDGVKLALEPERWAWLRAQTEGADAKLSAAAIKNIEAWWNSAAVNSDQRETLTRLIDEKAVDEIRAGFESEKDILEPGTAGTRGEMENLKAVEVKDLKVGVNYVSTTMVIRYANAFARRYLETNQKGPVFITKEVRDNSDSYADVAAKILISNGIPVIRVHNAVSTPLASYLARWLKQNEVEAAFGFQISASHNAWSNNGIKFMGSDGQQLMPDDMAEIMKRIPKLDATPAVPDLDLRSNLLYEEISQKKFEEILEAYFDAIDNTLTPDFKNLIQEAFKNKSNRFVFTALNGASGSETKLYLSRLGLEEGRDYFIVEEEMIPPSEIKDSELKKEVLRRKNSDPAAAGLLDRAQALADQKKVNFVIARDPDGDRFVASIRTASGWEKLNGNENGLLMEEDRLSHASKEDQKNSVYVRSHATSSEADEVVKAYGGKVIITPVGFKYPGAILGLLGNVGRRFFAHEESYGTGNGQIAEKDGLSGLANFLIILVHLEENESVFDKLQSIRMQYGFKGDAIQNYEIPGSDKASRDAAKARVIQKFDDLKVGETLGSFVITDKITEIKTPVGDFTDGYIFILEDPAANKKFQLVFRASGTEPIFKAYFSLVEGVKSKDPADFKTKSKEVLDYSKNTVFPKVGEALASFAGSRLALTRISEDKSKLFEVPTSKIEKDLTVQELYERALQGEQVRVEQFKREIDQDPTVTAMEKKTGKPLRELKKAQFEQALRHNFKTGYGSTIYYSNITNRSAGKTFHYEIDGFKVDTDQKAADPAFVEKLLKAVEQHLNDRELIQVDRSVGQDPSNSRHFRLLVDAKYGRLGHELTALHFAAGEGASSETPDILTIDLPDFDLSEYGLADKKEPYILRIPSRGINLVLGTDYFGEIKKSALTTNGYLAKQEGNLALHAGSKIVKVRDPKTGNIKSIRVIAAGLSGTGKTTTLVGTQGLGTEDKEEASVMKQDDYIEVVPVRSSENKITSVTVKGLEAGVYYKTERLDPKKEPELFEAAKHKDTILSNVWMDETSEGLIPDYNNLDISGNGRGVVLRSQITQDSSVDMDGVDIVIWLTRRETIVPAMSILPPAQAAALFLLGESVITAAADPTRAGQSVREAGFSPFIVGSVSKEANLLLEIFETLPDIKVILLNTGKVGVDYADANRPGVKIDVPDSAALLRALYTDDVETIIDPDWGYDVAANVPNYDISKLDPSKHYSKEELESLTQKLRDERVNWLKRFPGLDPKIINAIQLAANSAIETKYFRIQFRPTGELDVSLKSTAATAHVYTEGILRVNGQPLADEEKPAYLVRLAKRIIEFERLDATKRDDKKLIKFDGKGELIRSASEPAYTIMQIIKNPSYVIGGGVADGTRLATVRRTVDRTTTLGNILADIFDEYDLRKEQIAIITVTDSRDGDREVSIEDTDREIYPGDTVVVEYNQGSRLVASVSADTILAESIGTQDFRSPELVARLSNNRLERIRAALEKPFDESIVSQKGKLNPEETITFVANVVRTTGKVGLLALGSALLQIQFGGGDEDDELVIYGLGEPIRIDNYKLVATENRDIYQVSVNTQDIKLALERLNRATYALDQAPESFYTKPVLLNVPVELWFNKDTLQAKSLLIPVLMAYLKAVHQHKYGKNAGIILQGNPEIVAEILARADQYFKSEERFVFSEDDTVPEFLKNAARVNLIAVREDSASPIPAENENERNLPAEALGKNEVPNMKSLKLALFEGRIEELEANDPEFRTFLGVYKELLGQDIKDLNEFIQVLEGKLTVLNALKRFALPPVMKLAVDSMIQVYEMMKRMAEQAA